MQNQQPWIFTLDNIFVDVTRQFPDNTILLENDITPGTQNTALTQKDKEFAQKIIQMRDGEYDSKELSSTVGGCAMNTCRAANMYLKALPEGSEYPRVITLGAIGKDQGGEFVQKQLKDENIISFLHIDDHAMTGQCAVTVVDADRTCIAILESCESYPTSHLQGVLAKPEYSNCLTFYTTGFFIGANWEALLTMAYHALDQNKMFGFNFAAEYTFTDQKDKILEIMKYSDFIFCNKQEALACGKHLHAELGLDTEEQRSNVKQISAAVACYPKLNKNRQRIAVFTDSEYPVTISIYDHNCKELQTFQVDVNPLDKGDVLDSNGAGDSFVGGFLAKMSLIESVQNNTKESVIKHSVEEITEAVKAGNLIAREVVQRYGCTFPTTEVLKDQINSQ